MRRFVLYIGMLALGAIIEIALIYIGERLYSNLPGITRVLR
jgi:hypothetical protein